MLKKYIPRTMEFLRWSKGHGARFHSVQEIDFFLADYLADACYGGCKGLDFGASTCFGFLALFP
eukprot:6847432-Alexandrium_andersonii.AAC.1